MANTEALLREGIEAVKANRKDEARTLLEKVVDLDQHNEQAWLYLSACVDSLEEQQICLENVLTINPNNQKARKGIEEISRKLASGPTSVSPFAETSASFGSGPFMGTDDMNSGDNTPTSVDWGRDSVPAHGSGRDVPQPTSEEYDSWMASLPIGGNKPAESESPFENFDFSAGPFTTTDAPFEDHLDQIDDPFGGSGSKSGSLPFDADTLSSGAGPFDDAGEDRFEFPSPKAAGADPFAGPSSFTGADRAHDRFGSRARESMIPAAESASPNDDDLDELFATGKSDVFGGTNDPFSALSKEKSGGTKRDRASASASSMYRLIPDEIQASSGAPSQILIITVGALAFLNLISLIMLLRNLSG